MWQFLQSLLFCFQICLHQVAKVFLQFGSMISIGCFNSSIEFTQIHCNVFSDEDKKQTWSKEETYELHVNRGSRHDTSRLSKIRYQIPEWGFPIKRIPCAIKDKILFFYCFDRLLEKMYIQTKTEKIDSMIPRPYRTCNIWQWWTAEQSKHSIRL